MSDRSYIWYNANTKEEVKSKDGAITIDYNRQKDESVVYLGGTAVSIATLSGDIDILTAMEVASDLGWTAIEVASDES